MPSKKKKSEVKIRGPVKIKFPNGTEVEVGLGGELTMSDEEYKALIEGADKIIKAAGSIATLVPQVLPQLIFEAAGEINSDTESDEFFTTDVALSDAATLRDFSVLKVGGAPLAWLYKVGAQTLAEGASPAAAGKTWVGFQTEPFLETDLQDIDSLAKFMLSLRYKQFTPTPRSVLPGRLSLILRNHTSGSNFSTTLSSVIDPTKTQPVVDCVSPRSLLRTGGQTITITGKNFLSGARVKMGTYDMASVTVVSGTQITAVTPPFNERSLWLVSVIQSDANGANASIENWQQVQVN
jgi:hypothetical protein